ncbi:hypothetical protein GCM10027290_31500 [Micromonospora sonneratiae]|uniref:Uncharacterized protein n=1 Tax=Micromonospora sonneratiae TaxID=1184706 RepID=A0ABW3YAT3_9ACTN
MPSQPLPQVDQTRRVTNLAPAGRRRVFRVAAGLVALAALSACGILQGETVEDRTLSYDYYPSYGEGYMNQLLSISNHTQQSVVPTLALQALDTHGKVLQDVSVTTVFGSDRGKVVVLPNGATDVLIFNGANLERVADVRVVARQMEVIEFPRAEVDVRTEPLDAAGRSVTRNDLFKSVVLYNDNPAPVTVRLVYIVWDVPLPDRTQQAQQVVPVGDLISVPGKGSVTVPMDGEAGAVIERTAGYAPASIKVYFSR